MAASFRTRTHPLNARSELRERPWRFNFFGLLRAMERTDPNKPRIGENLVPKDEIVEIGQDPYLDFPGSNITSFEERPGRSSRLRVRFMGYFGPHGALPLVHTEEVLEWKSRRSDGFIRFADIFGGRFYQLFFRGWSSSRRIAQFDRPKEDRFQDYVRAVGGVPIPSPKIDGTRDLFPMERLHIAGLLGSRIRGPGALKRILETSLGVSIEVEEFIPSWIDFEEDDRSQLGTAGSTIGVDMKLGSRVQAVSDKIRIHLRTKNAIEYRRFLPGQPGFEMLTDLAQGYLGPLVDVEVAPTMPANQRPAMQIGAEGTIGHTSWLAPKVDAANPEQHFEDAVFSASSDHQNEKEPKVESA